MANTTECGIEYLQENITGVSILIPCKDEEHGIGLTIDNVHAAMAQTHLDYEIIVIDDGSRDNTREQALQAGARVLVHEVNLGYGNSLMHGITVARYPLIAMLDGDGTYPCDMLLPLIDKARTHDMAIGKRTWTESNTTLKARLMRRMLAMIIHYFTRVHAEDFNSGLRVFHKLNVLSYRELLCPTFSFTTTLTLLYLLTARSVCFVPITYGQRIGNSKVFYFRDALKTFLYVFAMTSLMQPYRMSLIFIGAAVVLNGLVGVTGAAWALGAATRIGGHLMVSTIVLVAALAMNTYIASTHYRQRLQPPSS